ncbi:spore germination protein [Neobacillus sp. 19]|uniref:spore germination protein n=1 Tax=Neobacillus sp. 19 TaxID=3394458 RepID=UPI003BF6794B
MTVNRDGVRIGTVSGGIVNFGGAEIIAPISITKTTSGAGEDNTGTVTSILDLISRSIK